MDHKGWDGSGARLELAVAKSTGETWLTEFPAAVLGAPGMKLCCADEHDACSRTNSHCPVPVCRCLARHCIWSSESSQADV